MRRRIQSVRNGMEIAEAIGKLYPEKLRLRRWSRLSGMRTTIEALREWRDCVAAIVASWTPALKEFRATRVEVLSMYE